MSGRPLLVTVSMAMLPLLTGCRSQPLGEELPVCSGETAALRARALDGSSFQPIEGMLVSIEVGGIYLPNPDHSKANPAFQLGARSGPGGLFELALPCGPYGLHTFLPGFRYGAAVVYAGQSAEIFSEPLLPLDRPPAISQASLSAQAVAPGELVTIQVMAVKGALEDPLSEEVVAVLPEMGQSMALDPPGPGQQGYGFPDGVWSRTFNAPSTPGTYAYQLIATTEGCVTSNRLELVLSVR